MLGWLSLAQRMVLLLSYMALGLGYVPGLRMNRATIALVSTAVLIALGTITLAEAWAAIDPNTIVFLLSMMVVNAYLAYAGFFDWRCSICCGSRAVRWGCWDC